MQEITQVSVAELSELATKMYDPLVKAVVDIALKRVVIDAELHFDEEQFLLNSGSSQEHLWGINLWPEEFGTADFIEFDSMINVRPNAGNRSRSVEDEQVQAQIRAIVNEVLSA